MDTCHQFILTKHNAVTVLNDCRDLIINEFQPFLNRASLPHAVASSPHGRTRALRQRNSRLKGIRPGRTTRPRFAGTNYAQHRWLLGVNVVVCVRNIVSSVPTCRHIAVLSLSWGMNVHRVGRYVQLIVLQHLPLGRRV